MTEYHIKGNNALFGELKLQGSKNASLPILAATLLTGSRSVIHNCPDLSDVRQSINILSSLGCECSFENNTAIIDSSNADGVMIDDELMTSMRSSIIYLGAILARNNRAVLSYPGGCELGPRPIDLHLSAIRRMGAEIDDTRGHIECSAGNGLTGCEIVLPIASVGATENIILAASLAKGRTIIRNAAKEPEIVDLASFLNSCGAEISGAGEVTVIIDGVKNLHGTEYSVQPDRIAAATYLCAAAATGGNIRVNDVVSSHLLPVLEYYSNAGCKMNICESSIELSAPKRLMPVGVIKTREYPGFPTDAQPLFLAMSSVSKGTSIFEENIFNSRYRYVDGLNKLGANISVHDSVAVVKGTDTLYGAKVEVTDLRGGAALIIGGLCAQGETVVCDSGHISRGYEKISENLNDLGAEITRY
ncbi:MAG: UDP-N-acetylglucosamine 1-carboxyvinyltransferase [Clostridia bacterium]|nr:UDP-N-acetylglucosamine 1-carboxyvinyltransferase [Clostridia bacterium]